MDIDHHTALKRYLPTFAVDDRFTHLIAIGGFIDCGVIVFFVVILTGRIPILTFQRVDVFGSTERFSGKEVVANIAPFRGSLHRYRLNFNRRCAGRNRNFLAVMIGVNQLALRYSFQIDVIEIDRTGITVFYNVINLFGVRLTIANFFPITAAVRVVIHELGGSFHRLDIFVVGTDGIARTDLEPLRAISAIAVLGRSVRHRFNPRLLDRLQLIEIHTDLTSVRGDVGADDGGFLHIQPIRGRISRCIRVG